MSAPKVSWSKRIAGVIAALLLLTTAFGPGIDALICHDESPVAALAAGANLYAEADRASDGAHDVCIHGHCHHAAAFLLPADQPVGRPLAARQRHVMAQTAVSRADRQFDLIRPPRA